MDEPWTTVASRLLAAIEPTTVLDVGDDGEHFVDSAASALAAWQGTLVCVRPEQRGPLEANVEVRSPCAPAAIASVAHADLVVLHGDPNWWTVGWQLAAVATAAEGSGRPLPPIVVAHAGGPWGRRDCYRDPNAVPPEFRQPHERDGELWVARDEGTPRNGVLTAVEEFARGRGGVDVISGPGLGGAAILYDHEAGGSLSADARALLREFRLSPAMGAAGQALDTHAGDGEELDALRRRTGALALQVAAERDRADRAQVHARELEKLLSPVDAGAGSRRSVVAGNGTLSDEPTRDLVRDVLRPAQLLRALGWPGGEDEILLPIPVDHRGVVDPTAASSLVLVADGRPLALRRTLCSILDRATEPVALTVVQPSPPLEAFGELLRALAVALPAIELVDAVDFRPRPKVQRLHAGDELPWGWPDAPSTLELPSVAYVLPGLPIEGSGGVLSIVQEARGLRALGAVARVCVPAAMLDRADRVYGNSDRLFVSYARDADLDHAVGDASMAVATEHTSVALVTRLARRRPELVCAYYIQDYEPLFAELGSARSDRALLSYGALPGATLFAKTHFVRNVVTALHHVPVAKVEPSLDRSLFTADRCGRTGGRLTVTAMLRPRTPRRRPMATLASLSMIDAALGDEATIVTFGCDAGELHGRDLGYLTHLGRLGPPQVAEQLRGSDIFIDASAYQAFGRSGLEAMACGAVPVLPSLGGAGEYAVDGENAILLDDDSPRAIAATVIALARDRARLERLRQAAIKTAAGFSIERAARSQLALFSASVAARAGVVPPPRSLGANG